MSGIDDRDALVALLRYTGAAKRWRDTTLRAAERGALAVLREEADSDLFDDPLPELLKRAGQEIEHWETAGIRVLSFTDEDFPTQLRDVHDFPPVIFCRGTLVPNDVGVCLVGSREASEEGIQFTRELATALVDEGVTVVSGLAKGIDSAAHTAALDRGGRTVAVIGTGITKCYPAENRDLQDRIIATGLVLSQFWPEAGPTRQSFPMRNATMSAYGEATVVVEAGEKSGARIQANQAVAHGRPLILTEHVATKTDWGRRASEAVGEVHVVSDVDEALAAIGSVIHKQEYLDQLLTSLVP